MGPGFRRDDGGSKSGNSIRKPAPFQRRLFSFVSSPIPQNLLRPLLSFLE
jgi:hypothetical protein